MFLCILGGTAGDRVRNGSQLWSYQNSRKRLYCLYYFIDRTCPGGYLTYLAGKHTRQAISSGDQYLHHRLTIRRSLLTIYHILHRQAEELSVLDATRSRDFELFMIVRRLQIMQVQCN